MITSYSPISAHVTTTVNGFASRQFGRFSNFPVWLVLTLWAWTKTLKGTRFSQAIKFILEDNPDGTSATHLECALHVAL